MKKLKLLLVAFTCVFLIEYIDETSQNLKLTNNNEIFDIKHMAPEVNSNVNI